MFLLDTSAVSDLMRADPRVAARFTSRSPHEIAIPQPVVAEVRYGLARLKRSRRRAELERRFEVIVAAVARCPWTDHVSLRFGELKAALERAGKRLDDFDLMIAAHALAYDATLVTSNTRHFARVTGLSLEDWASD